MEHYTVGSDAEALDSFGFWHCCTVKSIEEVGVKVYLLAGQTSGTGPSRICRVFAMYVK